MAQIITFYSFKGGVGRTMALANVACSIASKGGKALIVDWDLEAPGLHRYFKKYPKETAANSGGTIGLLETMASDGSPDSSQFESTVQIPRTEFFPGCELELLAAGMESENYERRVLDFDFEDFYQRKQGAAKLEILRLTWRDRFDFVLIDSRTGITDTGGICTIFLPDILALVFTANEQSLAGAISIAHRAQKGRQALSFDRRGLTIFPVPSRFDSRTEQEEAEAWMMRFSDEMSPFLSAWCPRDVAPRSLLERIKIPHVPFFSFGEKLPIVTHTSSDPDLPGFYYQNIAAVLQGEFGERAILSACGIAKEFVGDISRIIKYAPAELIGRDNELRFLSDAWGKVRRGDSARPNIITFVAIGGEGKTSLVAKWAAELAHQDWPGCDAAFAWSFYSQGTREQMAASSDVFLKEGLTFFGDATMAGSELPAFDKGRRLAQLIGERRALLILDGLEPLQYAPTSPTPGEFKDVGLAALLKGLAAANHGLCLITTRYSIPDLRAYWQTTAPEVKLERLTREAGVVLLNSLGVKGRQEEFEQLVEDARGHALTLNLLGAYLRDAHAGDIRKRDLVNLEEADAEEQGGHAFRVMDAEVRELEGEGEKGERAIAILRLLGLFDRPAAADRLAALLKAPVIPGLTEMLVGMSEAQRNLAIKRLEDARLLTSNRNASGTLLSLDMHPLLREYFARQLRGQHAQAWRAAHRRLYEYLCASTADKDQPTLKDLQPLYQAVAHGCQAGLQREALAEVYRARITQGTHYSWKKLGSFGSDLGAVACFFEVPWSRVSPALTEGDQAWLLSQAAFYLRALGRLAETLDPMRAGLENYVKQENWRNAAITARNLSQLEVTLGEVAAAVEDAEQSVIYAERSAEQSVTYAERRAEQSVSYAKPSDDEDQPHISRATYADALHQAGRRVEAEASFRIAEHTQAEFYPKYPLLYGARGFKYCDLLLATPERAAWQETQKSEDRSQNSEGGHQTSELALACRAVAERAEQTLKWVTAQDWLLDIALDHLILGRAALYEAILEDSDSPLLTPRLISNLDYAVAGLRRAGAQYMFPLGLLTRAWLRFLTDLRIGPESAQADLDEAWEIAERGPMRLFMADIHLYRARLFGGVKDEGGGLKYPWDKNPDGTPRGPKDDLVAARKLIEQCGYWRRKEELEDAEEAAKNW